MTGVQSGAVGTAESVSMLPGEADALVQSKNGKKRTSPKALSSEAGPELTASKLESPGKAPIAEIRVISLCCQISNFRHILFLKYL